MIFRALLRVLRDWLSHPGEFRDLGGVIITKWPVNQWGQEVQTRECLSHYAAVLRAREDHLFPLTQRVHR